MSKKKKPIITTVHNIEFPSVGKKKGNMLIFGLFEGILGDASAKTWEDLSGNETSLANLDKFAETLHTKHNVYMVGGQSEIDYFHNMYAICQNNGYFESEYEYKWRNMFGFSRNDSIWKNYTTRRVVNDIDSQEDWLSEITNIEEKGMKFDTIILNPPYDGSFHLKFLERGIDLLTPQKGKMVIIEPATWLINIRKNGKAKRYDEIKKKLGKHIQSVVIENLNKEFGVNQSMPFATTTIDMSKEFDTIDFTCCGETKKVNSIYDCNLIGKYDTIWGILSKVQSYGDLMDKHITNEDRGNNYWYCKCGGINKDSLMSGAGSALCAACGERVGVSYDGESIWTNTTNGKFLIPYTSILFHYFNNEISNSPLHSYDQGKHLTEKIAWNVFGTKSEIENWKHFTFNNKLSLFITICTTDNQHNNATPFLPWLVDKEYTDEEINTMFGFTDEEIKLIDTTIKKYERNSPWFKRYMCGKDSVSDEEVNNFIAEISR